MGDVVKLTVGRVKRGKKLPKPIECKECGDPIETARLQALGLDDVHLRPQRCVACASAWERRFEREMDGVREWQAVEVIR